MAPTRISALLALGALLMGCQEDTVASPFSVAIENHADVPLLMDGHDEPHLGLSVLWDDAWVPLEVPDILCYRPCGSVPGTMSCGMSISHSGSFVLLPGDSAVVERSGEHLQPKRDGFGECRKVAPLEGPLLVEVCYG